MRGLTLLIATADLERARAGLTVACAQAALGGRVRVYFHEDAVALLLPSDAADPRLAAAGIPAWPELVETALASGVELIVCQTGLALAGIGHDSLVPGTEAGGLVGLLATLGEDRLLAF